MSKKRSAVPADEARADGAVDKNEGEPQVDEGGFLDILGFGDEPQQDDAGDGDGDPTPIEKAAAKDVLSKLTPILGKLTGAVTKTKDLGDKAMPPDVAKTIGEVVASIKAIAGKADDAADDAAGDKSEKADGGPLASSVAKLTAIVEQVKKAGDGDAPDVLGKLKAIASALEGFLSKQANKAKAEGDDEMDDDGKPKKPNPFDGKGKGKAKKTEKAFEVYKAAGSEGDADPEVIIKSGAKMKKSRLSQLKKAVETLSEMVKELEGENGQTAKSETPVDLSPVLSRIDEMASAVKARFETLEEKSDAVNKRVETIENTRPAGNGEGDPPKAVKKSDGNFWAGVL